jgi:GAF domain-containing protein
MKDDAASAGNDTLAEQLQRLLLAIEATGRAALPSSSDELLETIVQAAARLFGAAAASIALVDEQEQQLVFRVAFGAGREQVVGMRIPLDQGIAGYVAMTGQPMTISNVQQDPRFARATAQKTGYVPRSILAMPLLRRDRVIGVMEVLDKLSAPAFGMQDMELLELFARQAAIAIDQAQQIARLNDALVGGIRTLLAADAAPATEIFRVLEENANAPARDLFELADRFNAISALGEAEHRACLQILNAFAEYTQSKSYQGG